MRLKDLPKEEWFISGHTACPGCGGAIAARIAMKVFGKRTCIYIPANCLLAFSGIYPLNAFKVPCHHVLFENSAVCAAGVSRGLKKLGKEALSVAFAGDGGTADIGLQALSGAAERNDDLVYICYDNEAYMNTGIQRSGATPYGAWTTTTPVGKRVAGKEVFKKDVPQIMIAHNVPYVATASVAHPMDYLKKLQKAKKLKGFRYLHVLTPCPPGWRAEPSKTIEIGKLAVNTGMWTLYECENGRMKINRKPKFTPIKEYLKLQGRFRHLSEEAIETLQKWVKEKWERDSKLAEILS